MYLLTKLSTILAVRLSDPARGFAAASAGEATVFLDANENAFISPVGGGLNRYPDPLQKVYLPLI